MQSVPPILGVLGVLMVFALILRLLDADLWRQNPRRLAVKIVLGLVIVALAFGLLYLLAPDFVFE